jgi:hypothetical protein
MSTAVSWLFPHICSRCLGVWGSAPLSHFRVTVTDTVVGGWMEAEITLTLCTGLTWSHCVCTARPGLSSKGFSHQYFPFYSQLLRNSGCKNYRGGWGCGSGENLHFIEHLLCARPWARCLPPPCLTSHSPVQSSSPNMGDGKRSCRAGQWFYLGYAAQKVE